MRRFVVAAVALCGSAATISAAPSASALLVPDNDVATRPASIKKPVSQAKSLSRVQLSKEQAAEAVQSRMWPREVGSILNVGRSLRYGEFLWDEQGVGPGRIWVRVDLTTQIISVFRGPHEIGTAVILFGAEDKQTPVGTFAVLSKSKAHRSTLYNAPMPFSLWLTSDGIAIHGSDVRRGGATHGCVGIPTEFARLLFEQAKPGSEVQIVRSAQVRA